jgi:hypothetical protein
MSRIPGEGIEISHPGIPGADNRWFPNGGEARKAALALATQMGAGHRIHHDAYPSLGLRHFHVLDPNGRRVSGHFFYGRRPPRRMYHGRPQRELEYGSEAMFWPFGKKRRAATTPTSAGTSAPAASPPASTSIPSYRTGWPTPPPASIARRALLAFVHALRQMYAAERGLHNAREAAEQATTRAIQVEGDPRAVDPGIVIASRSAQKQFQEARTHCRQAKDELARVWRMYYASIQDPLRSRILAMLRRQC